jgi:lipid-binding SYLF domain-containing protein
MKTRKFEKKESNMRIKPVLTIVAVVAMAITMIVPVQAAEQGRQEVTRVQDAIGMLQEVGRTQEMGVPREVLRDAAAIAIIPNMVKAAFVVGGERGSGVLMVREGADSWSDPVFISATGASMGAQLGVEAMDVLLVFRNRQSVDNLLGGQLQLGADATAAAGDQQAKAKATTGDVLVYTRTGGLFAGASLSGAVLQVENRANESFYGASNISSTQILAGLERDRDVSRPDVADELKDAVNKFVTSK